MTVIATPGAVRKAISDMVDELRARAETAKMFPEGVTSAVAVSTLLDELADRLSTIADDCADALMTEGAK